MLDFISTVNTISDIVCSHDPLAIPQKTSSTDNSAKKHPGCRPLPGFFLSSHTCCSSSWTQQRQSPGRGLASLAVDRCGHSAIPESRGIPESRISLENKYRCGSSESIESKINDLIFDVDWHCLGTCVWGRHGASLQPLQIYIKLALKW